MTREQLLEGIARAMMREVFHEIDVETASLDWTGNDVWGCDFGVMAHAVLDHISPMLDEVVEQQKEAERLCDLFIWYLDNWGSAGLRGSEALKTGEPRQSCVIFKHKHKEAIAQLECFVVKGGVK